MTSPREQTGFRVLRKLAESAGKAGGAIFSDVQAAEYDWGVPYHFNKAQLVKVQQLGVSLAEAVSRALAKHLRKSVETQLHEVRQFFARRLGEAAAADGGYALPLACEKGPCGAVLVDAAVVVGWVAKLLGAGEEGGDPARKLSELENELLADTMSVLLGAVNEVFKQAGGQPLTPGGPPSAEPVTLPGHATAEYCCFTFKPQASEERPAMRLMLFCELLEPMVGAEGSEQANGPSPEAMRQALMEHFARAPVTAAAFLGQTALTLRDLVNLEPGDVLLLPGQPGDPIELRVENTAVCAGYLATCQGQYAIEVSQSLVAVEGGRPGRQTPKDPPQKGT